MKPKGRKAKGDNFERLIARQIGLWWCQDKDVFWRTSGSGARAHRDDIHPGDIGPVKNLPTPFPFCLELRNRQSWSLDEILKSKVPDILVWMVENSEVAGPSYLSVLIVSKNYYPPLIVIPNWLQLTLNKCPDIQMGVGFHPNYFSLLIMHLDKFFELYPPEVFEETEPNGVLLREMKAVEIDVCRDIKRYLDSK